MFHMHRRYRNRRTYLHIKNDSNLDNTSLGFDGALGAAAGQSERHVGGTGVRAARLQVGETADVARGPGTAAQLLHQLDVGAVAAARVTVRRRSRRNRPRTVAGRPLVTADSRRRRGVVDVDDDDVVLRRSLAC